VFWLGDTLHRGVWRGCRSLERLQEFGEVAAAHPHLRVRAWVRGWTGQVPFCCPAQVPYKGCSDRCSHRPQRTGAGAQSYRYTHSEGRWGACSLPLALCALEIGFDCGLGFDFLSSVESRPNCCTDASVYCTILCLFSQQPHTDARHTGSTVHSKFTHLSHGMSDVSAAPVRGTPLNPVNDGRAAGAPALAVVDESWHWQAT